MKQEEKTRITYEKILKAAIAEFGTKSYDSASLNTICNKDHISKGSLYHNFKNKDELYLRCVEVCFQTMTEYLRSGQYHGKNAHARLRELLLRRKSFFEENPYFSRIFFDVILHPPAHLQRKLQEIRREMDEFHLAYYKKQLASMQLRDGIEADMAVKYFVLFQNMFNEYCQSKSFGQEDFHAVVQDHEIGLSQILDIMLYGIAKEDPMEETLYGSHNIC